MRRGWRGEGAFLLACCREGREECRRPLELPGGPMDWHALLTLARREGVAPLLFWQLRQAGLLGAIPVWLAETLSRGYYATGAAAVVWQDQLQGLLPRCRQAGCPVLVLKGAVLADRCYATPALRAMQDIDLLVRPLDLPALHDLLGRQGYRADDGQGSGSRRPGASSYLTTRYYRPTEGRGLPFHVHTHLVNSTIPNSHLISGFPMAPIWQAARRETLCGEEALVLAPHHQLLHLAEHSLRVTHSLSRLQYLCDLDRAVRHYGSAIDWEALCREGREWGLAPFLHYPLALAGRWLQTPVPAAVSDRLAPGPAGLPERLFAALLANNIRRPGLSYLLHLSLQPSGRAQAVFVMRTLFPPREVIALRSRIPVGAVGPVHYLRRAAEVAITLLHLTRPGSRPVRPGSEGGA